MHKVSTANAVNEPGRVGWWGVGSSAARFPALGGVEWLAFCGPALVNNPSLNLA